jgi:antitoxin component YwqK of YwqJK toxin-antitoxin module
MENINQVDGLGRKQGLWIAYWENGNIFYETNYLDDQFHGLDFNYSKNGNLWYKSIFFEGQKIAYNLYFMFNSGVFNFDEFYFKIF